MPTRLRVAAAGLLAMLAAVGVAEGVTSASASGARPQAETQAQSRSLADAPTTGSSAADAAWRWIASQSGSGTTVTSASQISGARAYPADWTGAVSGTFTPHGVSAPVEGASPIVVDTPAAVPGSYAGVVTGHLTATPSPGRWIVQAYRDTPSGRVQVPLQTLVDPAGDFRIDLGAVNNPPAGSWALGLLDAHNAYTPSGTAWPDPGVYTGWQVRAYVVTDTAYLVGQQPARSDNTFSFADSRPGTKVFQLVDTATGKVLAEQAPDFGLLRSQAGSTRVYTYDQALAVITGLDVGADVDPLVSGLRALQRPDGSFAESADVRNPAAADPISRTGIDAVAGYALLRAAQAMAADDPDRAVVLAAARSGVERLVARQRPDGLIGAGTGDHRADGSLDPAAVPGWVSTEHNLDAWQTLHLAGTVLTGASADAGFAPAVTRLAAAIVSSLWDAQAGRFRQGRAADGTADTTDPLDVSSWGALFLTASGHPDLAAQALAHTATFRSERAGQSGYRAYYPQPAFPQAIANVWAEGSAGVVLARARTGDTTGAAADLARLAGVQRPDGSLPYAVATDDSTSMSSAPSVAATAWFVLVLLPSGRPSIWD